MEPNEGQMGDVDDEPGNEVSELADYVNSLIAEAIAMRTTEGADSQVSPPVKAAAAEIVEKSEAAEPVKNPAKPVIEPTLEPAVPPAMPPAVPISTPAPKGTDTPFITFDAFGSTKKPRPERASMREELLALFRSTEPVPSPTSDKPVGTPLEPGDNGGSADGTPASGAADPASGSSASTPARSVSGADRPAVGADPAIITVKPSAAAPTTGGRLSASPFLEQYLDMLGGAVDVASSGLADLDLCLGGGYGRGVYVIQGRMGSGKTALLQCALWEAVSSGRPTRYYAFKDGGLPIWQRLIVGLGNILGKPAPSLAGLKDRVLLPQELEAVINLDITFQNSVTPYLTIIETIPATAGVLGGLIGDVREAVEESQQYQRHMPLVLLDDLESLLLLFEDGSPVTVLSYLDEVFSALRVPCLVAMDDSTPLDLEPDERLPGRSVLHLTNSLQRKDAFARLTLEIRANETTKRTGKIPLLLDLNSGLLAASPDGDES